MRVNRYFTICLSVLVVAFIALLSFITTGNDVTYDKYNILDERETAEFGLIEQTSISKNQINNTDDHIQTIPHEPRVFDSLESFDTWVKSAEISFEAEELGSEYYDYLRPQVQEMLIEERYYLLPVVPKNLSLMKIIMRPMEISFQYIDEYKKMYYYTFDTRSGLFDQYAWNDQNYTKIESNGITYYIEKEGYRKDSVSAYCDLDGYGTNVTVDIDNANSIDTTNIISVIQFEKVMLPALSNENK